MSIRLYTEIREFQDLTVERLVIWHGTYTYTKGKNCKVSSLNSLRKLVFQIPDFQSLHNRV